MHESLSSTFLRVIHCPWCDHPDHYLFDAKQINVRNKLIRKCPNCKKDFFDIPNANMRQFGDDHE